MIRLTITFNARVFAFRFILPFGLSDIFPGAMWRCLWWWRVVTIVTVFSYEGCACGVGFVCVCRGHFPWGRGQCCHFFGVCYHLVIGGCYVRTIFVVGLCIPAAFCGEKGET